MKLSVQHFFDANTYTLTYVICDENTRDAVIIDPVLDFRLPGAVIGRTALDQLLAWINERQLNLRMILETHAHADHLSSSQFLKMAFPQAVLGVGEHITKVQETFKSVFDLDGLPTDGSQFDLLLRDGEIYKAGSLQFTVLHTPGHTPACCSYIFDKSVFVGDLIFMPDYGTGRCDFPAGSASASYRSITHKLFSLPDDTLVYVGHDYMPNGRALAFVTTLAEQKAHNIHINAQTTEEQFVAFRTERDATLAPPKLLYESVQFNIDAGYLPAPHKNGRRYFRLPLQIDV